MILITIWLILAASFNSQTCPILCNSCTTSTQCSECFSQFYSDSQILTNTPICGCPRGFYMSTNQNCFFCPSRCQTCTNSSLCLTCINGYSINSKGSCERIQTYIGDWLSTQIKEDLNSTQIATLINPGFELVDSVATSGSMFVNCSGLPSLPFFGIYFFDFNTQLYKSYFSLPYHQWAQIKFQFAAIDQWQEDNFILQINEKPSYSSKTIENTQFFFYHTFNSSIRKKNFCASASYNDNLGIMDAYFEHYDSMIKLRIRTGLTDKNPIPSYANFTFFGIRQVILRVGTCPRNCLRCNNPRDCIECKNLYQRAQNGSCICNLSKSFQTYYGCHPLCQPGTFVSLGGSNCLLCSLFFQNCKTCSSSENCTECGIGSFLHGGRCVRQCPMGYQVNGSKCQACASNCRFCVNGQCLICQDNSYRNLGNCVSECPITTYPYIFTGYCAPCGLGCAKCVNEYICTQCLSNLSNVKYSLVYGQCEILCSNTNSSLAISFFDSFGCPDVICNSSCSACIGNSSNQCMSCNSPLILEDYSCVSACKQGNYRDGNLCRSCPDWCSSCNQTHCQTCKPGYSFYIDRCVLFCPLGFYHSNNKCVACSENCTKCLDGNSCTICKYGWFSFEGKCVNYQICPTSTYFDWRVFRCENCPTNCTKCFRTLCYECSSSYYLDNGQCLSNCSREKIKTNTGICQWKNYLCQKYEDIQNPKCIECAYLGKVLGLDSQCLYECPSGKGLNLLNLKCETCPSKCLNCQINSQCIRCENGYVLSSNGTCINSCPDGQMSDSIQCFSCPLGCTKCNSDASCKSCASGYTLNSTTKRCSCTDANLCPVCSSNCLACSNNSNSCTSCPASKYLSGTSCVSSCTGAYFADTASMECRPCKPQCTFCTSFQKCTLCDYGYYLLEGRCTKACSNGFYPNIQLNQCQKCASNCRTCFGGLPDQCLSCFEDDIMDHTRCVKNCAIGRYQDKDRHCDWCHQSCERCWGPADFQCIYCNSNYSIYKGFCYEICPAATYVSYNSSIYNSLGYRVCLECQWGCATCSSSQSCQQCFGGFYLQNGICMSQCREGYYSQNYNYTCRECSSNCSRCSNQGCEQCIEPFYRYNLNCYTICPYGTYSSNSALKQCLKCPNCKNCSNATKCYECERGYTLLNGICSNQCKLGYVRHDNDCQQCDDKCLTCSEDECLSCKAGYYLSNGKCVTTCESISYGDDSGYCNNCPQNCLSCSSLTNCTTCKTGYTLSYGQCTNKPATCPSKCAQCSNTTYCTFCQVPYYLWNGNCVEMCQTGYYEVGRECKRCLSRCSQCDDFDKCTKCQSGLVLFESKCVDSCSWGYANVASKCQKCSQNCNYCVNTTSCTSCLPNYLLISGYCKDKCPQTTYYSANSKSCESCTSGCITCIELKCYKCQPQYYLFNNTCVQNCPINYFKNQATCSPCDSTCNSCSTSDQCTTCAEGYSLKDNKCYRSCPSGFYSSSSNCLPCSSQCKECFNNASSCISCPTGSSLVGLKCVSECPSGSWGLLGICFPCDPYCLQCNPDGKCKSCHPLTVISNYKCLSSCPDGTYNYSGICVSCQSPCKTCFGNSIYECQSCLPQFYYLNGRCFDTCPSGYFKHPDSYSCKPCLTSCAQCTDINKCTSCKTGYTLTTNNLCSTPPTCNDTNCKMCDTNTTCQICVSGYFLYNNQCVNSCPTAKYLNLDRCESCDTNCLSCTKSTSCDTCASGYFKLNGKCYASCPIGTIVSSNNCIPDPCYSNGTACSRCLSPYFLYQGVCVVKCPTNTFQSSECIPCPTNCLTCSSLDKCLTCTSPNILFNSQCISTCPQGYRNINGVCQVCQQNCLKCSSSSCNECNSGYFLYNNVCVGGCPVGTYQNVVDKTCVNCVTECLSCSTQTLCSSCKTGYVLNQGKCISTCPQGKYKTSSNLCVSCSTNCLTCQNSSLCTLCSPGTYLQNNVCVKQCLVGYIATSANNCQPCTAPCQTCIYDKTICTSCVSGYYYFGSVQGGKCQKTCPKGYLNSSNGQCVQCSPTCFQCANNTNYCTVCVKGYTLDSYGNCNQNCSKATQYFDDANYICRDCSPDCYSCYGPSYTQCISCKTPLVLSKGQCVPSCPLGYYINGGVCEVCDLSKCRSCSGTSTNCQTCLGVQVLINGKCLNECPSGYYSNNGICSSCSSSCLQCSELPNKCTKCVSPKYLTTTNTCIQVCPPPSMVSLNGVCQNCGSGCLQCSVINSTIQCSKCIANYAILGFNCVSQCPTGTYNLNNVCINCNSSCASCLNSNTCYQCVKPNVKYLDTCLVSCPSNFVSINSKCQPNTCLGYMLDQSCVNTCPTGYYPDLTLKICNPCGYSCNVCSSSTTCTQCASQQILLNGKCIKECPSGFVKIDNLCAACLSPCSKCLATTTSCTQCLSPYILFNSQCLSTCPSKFYLSGTNCIPCPSECATCSAGTCQTCVNTIYSPPLCKDTSCNSTQYKNPSNTCTPCASTCLTCYGGLDTNCLTCPTSMVLINGQCRSSCPQGYYTSNLSCYQCSTLCLSCTQTACTQCRSGFFLVNGNCISNCQQLNTNTTTYYASGSSCVSCPTNCEICINSSTCSKCLTNYNLNNGLCTTTCPPGTYLNANQCLSCSPCLTCSANKVCTSCPNGQYLSSSKCVTACPQGSILNTTSLSCYKCGTNCLTCTNSSSCTLCNLPYVLINGACSGCTTGYFMSGTICQQCLSTCKACLSASSCTECYTGMLLSNGLCVYNCPDSFYVSGNSCQPCSTSCLKCLSSSVCQNCLPGYILSGSSCVTSCPSGTYKDVSSNTCQNCPSNCATCTTLTQCSTCKTGLVLYLADCFSKCPDGTTNVNGSCVTCRSGCKSCPNSLDICQVCESNLILNSGGTCIPDPNCPDGKYRVISFQFCVDCHPSCLKCINGAATDCTSCKTSYTLTSKGTCESLCPSNQYMLAGNCTNCPTSCQTCDITGCTQCPIGKTLSNGTCITNCPTNTYLYNQQCNNCPTYCLTCTSSTQCNNCTSSGPIFFNNMCYQTCPDGSFLSGVNQCTTCPSNCITCSSLTSCQSCLYPKRLFNNECLGQCPSGTFPTGNANTCTNCPSNCTSCNSISNCFTCNGSLVLLNGSCVNSCPDQYYNNVGICTSCLFPCLNCQSASICKSCVVGYFLQGTICKNQCSDGMFMENGVCKNCIVNNCKACNSTPICISCKIGYFLFNATQCVTNCPSGMYGNIQNQNAICSNCLTNCQTCIDSQSCQKCQTPFKLYNGNSCVSNCPDQTYNNNQECKNCEDRCLRCRNPDICQICLDGFFLYKDSCFSECPDSFYGTSKVCQPCGANCSNCLNSTQCYQCTLITYTVVNGKCIHQNCLNCLQCQDNKCTNCSNSYFLYSDRCVTDCPIGTYANITTNSCEKCIKDCVLCTNSTHCRQCIQNYIFVNKQIGCIDEGVYQFGALATMSGFTSNITQITTAVYLGTAVGPMAFGEMSNTYFNIEFCQFILYHQSQAGNNSQMKTFLNSLEGISLSASSSSSSSSSSSQSSTTNSNLRLLQSVSSSSSFLKANMMTFVLIGCFLSVYAATHLVMKGLPYMMEGCPKIHFYLNEICIFLQKRFKWIYFDFILWISYLPFLYFGIIQIKNFSFQNGEKAISSLISIAILATYPLYPFFICYIIKSHYDELCLANNTLTQMSLSPYVFKVKRPTITSENQNFKWITVQNIRFINYPLKYIRKFIFILVVTLSTVPINSVSILIALNVFFIAYLFIFRPREMPYLIFDIIIEFVILFFELFMLVYLTISESRVSAMSIVTQAVGFITANLSLIVAIILNLIAYYKIFICIYDLIKHLKEKIEEKEKNELKEKGQGQAQGEEHVPEVIDEKMLPQVVRRDDDERTQQQFDGDKEQKYMLDEKELMFNGLGPKRQSKINMEFEEIPELKISKKGRRDNKKHAGKDSDDQMMSQSRVSDQIILDPGKQQYKRQIGKDKLLLQKGIIKQVTKDRFKRKQLGKITSYQNSQDIDQFEISNDKFIKENKKYEEVADPFDFQFKRKDLNPNHPIDIKEKNRLPGAEVIDKNKRLPFDHLQDHLDSQKINKDKPTDKNIPSNTKDKPIQKKNTSISQDIPQLNLRAIQRNLNQPNQGINQLKLAERQRENIKKGNQQEKDLISGDFLDRQTKKKNSNQTYDKNVPDGDFVNREKKGINQQNSEKDAPDGKFINREKKGNNHQSPYKNISDGNFLNREKKGKGNNNQSYDRDVPDGDLLNREKKGNNNQSYDRDVPDGDFLNREKKGNKNQSYNRDIPDGDFLNREKKGKNMLQSNNTEQVPQGNIKEKQRQKNTMLFEDFDEFINEENNNDNNKVPSGKIKQKQILKNNSQNPFRFDNDDQIQYGNFKNIERKAPQNNPQNKLQNNDKQAQQAIIKDRQGKNLIKPGKLFNDEDQIEEVKIYDHHGHRQKKNQTTNKHPNQNQYQQEQIKTYDRQGKYKRNIPNKNQGDNQDKKLEEGRIYEHNGNKFKRNIPNNASEDVVNIDGKLFEREKKNKGNKITEQQQEKQEMPISEGRLFDHNGQRKDRDEKQKYNKNDEKNEIAEGKTVELKSKKAQKQDVEAKKGGFFQNFMNQKGSDSVIFNAKQNQIIDFEEDEYDGRKVKGKGEENKPKDNYLQTGQKIEESYEDIVRKNKQNTISPEIKGKGRLKVQENNSDDIQDSSYSRPASKIQKSLSKDKGLGIHFNGDSESQDEGPLSSRKARALASQRLRSNKPMKINQNLSQVFQDGSGNLDPRKAKQSKIQRRGKKSGILKIREKDDGGDSDNLDSIQL